MKYVPSKLMTFAKAAMVSIVQGGILIRAARIGSKLIIWFRNNRFVGYSKFKANNPLIYIIFHPPTKTPLAFFSKPCHPYACSGICMPVTGLI